MNRSQEKNDDSSLKSPAMLKEKAEDMSAGSKHQRNLSNLIPHDNYIGGLGAADSIGKQQSYRSRGYTMDNFLVMPGMLANANQDDLDSAND